MHLIKSILLRVCCAVFVGSIFLFLCAPSLHASTPDDDKSWSVHQLNSLTLEQKIAQLLMIRVRSDYDSKTLAGIYDIIAKYQPGGVCFFQGGPVREISVTNKLQSLSSVPMLISIDGEWGPAMRLDSCTVFPRQMTLGALSWADDSLIYQMGFEMARQCLKLGIHIDFAPCVDINNNSRNPVINSRAFGETPELVTRKSLFLMHGLQDAGESACIKHFPGHGDTRVDSHVALPTISNTRFDLEQVELFPYRRLIAAGVDMVMVSHLNVPALDDAKNSIASLSFKIITELLRKQMGFDGIIITDAMDMNGLRNYYSHSGDAEIAALLAGVDILLLPSDLKVVINAISDAVRNGKISEELINEKCLRVLRFKESKGLTTFNTLSLDSVYQELNNSATQSLINKIEAKALTLLRNRENLLPLNKVADSSALFLCIGSCEDSTVYRQLANQYNLGFMQLPRSISKQHYSVLIDSMNRYDTIIVAVLETNQFIKYNYGVYTETIDFLNMIPEDKKIVFALFGNPYALSSFKNLNQFSSVIVGYQCTCNSVKSMMKAAFGEAGFTGQLPVSSGPFKVLSGIVLRPTKEDSVLNKDNFSVLPAENNHRIDSLVEVAIENKIIPGCQILAMQSGKPVYYKNFGNQRYDGENPITSETLYDVASMTKSLATTLAVMKLYDEDKIDLHDKIGKYLPYLNGTDKANLTLVELLTHTSGLPAFIPFYREIAPAGKWNNTYLSKTKNTQFSVQVAENVFVRSDFPDMVRKKIANCQLGEKKYVYSDLGFILLKDMVEEITGEDMSTYLKRNFYEPLGLAHTTFNPRDFFDKNKIAPTENDTYFRFQVIQGYVHDQSAAVFGGVCGNAGLFSTAKEVSVILSMLMNGGTWNGKTYFSNKTVKQFTSTYSIHGCHRRALGFDTPSFSKNSGVIPVMAANTTYGHQGFTGTVFWCDPENDLIYVFLSNRVYPNAEPNNLSKSKLRLYAHEEIYKGLGLK
ncbi:MAG: glycoside hydrolase family 3 N-terminal domain-containing protein [Bacteroidales bacterium]|nr:glycoside hydrolase family 3 N-terminal domain-containing protein [Bacteroidales bacterium]